MPDLLETYSKKQHNCCVVFENIIAKTYRHSAGKQSTGVVENKNVVTHALRYIILARYNIIVIVNYYYFAHKTQNRFRKFELKILLSRVELKKKKKQFETV